MYKNLKKNVAIIGNNSDLVEYCIPILSNSTYKIVCLFSENPVVERLLLNTNIFMPGNINEFSEFIKQNKVDYLLSIENPFIIPDDVLSCISVTAINYHNSLLPAYGGQHSIVWPIWYNEHESGVTWHIIGNLLDGGDILVQRKFTIESNETAFSLDLKCQEAAKDSFTELIEKLAQPNALQGVVQDVSRRSLYSSFSRPCGFAIIDFNDRAENIYRQYRALAFSTKNNPITVLKFKVKEAFYAALNISVSSTQSSETPGIITNISDNIVQITTATQDILIDYVSLPYNYTAILDNRHIGEQLFINYNLAVKYQLIAESIAKDESYWLKQLFSFKPGKHFIQNQRVAYNDYQEMVSISLNDLNYSLSSESHLNTLEEILTIFTGYLYKVNDYEDFSICLSGVYSNSSDNFIDPICSNIVPLNINLTSKLDFKQIKGEVSNTFSIIKQKKPYLKDMLLRYLGSDAIFSNTLLINFGILENAAYYYPIIININPKTYHIRLLVAKNYEAPLFLTFIESHLILLINQWVLKRKGLDKFSLLSNKELVYLTKWNNTTDDYPQNASIPQLIDGICAKFPDHIALEASTSRLTYRELKGNADKIAKNILSNTNRDNLIGEKIAVFLDKSINTVVTFIAVLKTGAAYIVLDTSYPDGYVENVINTSQTNVYITSESNQKRLGTIIRQVNLQANKILLLDGLLNNNSSQNICLPGSIPSDSLAYVLFTSGSTGRPKGIMIRQKSLANFTSAVIKTLGIKETDKALQFATLAFDTSIWEIYNTLLAGATLYIPEKSEVIVGESFENTILSKKLTLLIIAPSILNIQPYFKSKHLRTIIVGGEACPKNVLLTWGANYHLINVYGPSECTVISTISDDLNAEDEVTIGRPLANCQITICDRYRMPHVLGAIGEIVISGAVVGNGYLNNPELTKQKFPEVNFFDKNQIGYFSGDTGKWTQSGELLYCGRSDFQIKIGGRLINLEAIEKAIVEYKGGVHTCIVLANAISTNNTSLNAYILLENNIPAIELDSLKSFLRSQLPCFMIPAKFFIINYLPLTASGKVDRQKLLSSNNWLQLVDIAKNLPFTKMQQELSSMWQEIIGISDNLDIDIEFFKLGGTSLQITQMILQLRKKYNVQISIADFLRCPTIKYLESMIIGKPGDNQQHLEDLVKQDLLKFKKTLSSEKITSSNLTDYVKKIKKVLLTGITGFLGTYLARYFLNHDIEIYCIVRTINPESFLDVIAKLKGKGWTDINLSKLHLINGDISRRCLGMNIELYEQLAQDIDAVCNCAAYVNHVFHYNQLKEVNVYGVWNCIEFCYTNKQKYFAHVSALSALSILKSGNRQEDFINLEDCKDFNSLSGYNLTKVVAELSISELIKQNTSSKIKIFRPGLIGADSITGAQDYESNHLTLLMKGCLQMGVFPKWDDLPINIIPVDCIAQFIVGNFLQIDIGKEYYRNVYNLLTDDILSFSDFSLYFAEKTTSKVDLIPFIEWQSLLNELQPENALYPLLPLYLEHNSEAITHVYKAMVSAKNGLFTKEYSTLRSAAIPPIKQQLSKYINFLSGKTFF